jgi:outer membrane murein-binding lipoprotein Lpp
LKGAFSLESVIVALIGGAVTLSGVIASNSKSRAVMEQKIDELTRRVEKHNCLVERTYLLERDVALLKNDVEDLERKAESHE